MRVILCVCVCGRAASGRDVGWSVRRRVYSTLSCVRVEWSYVACTAYQHQLIYEWTLHHSSSDIRCQVCTVPFSVVTFAGRFPHHTLKYNYIAIWYRNSIIAQLVLCYRSCCDLGHDHKNKKKIDPKTRFGVFEIWVFVRVRLETRFWSLGVRFEFIDNTAVFRNPLNQIYGSIIVNIIIFFNTWLTEHNRWQGIEKQHGIKGF